MVVCTMSTKGPTISSMTGFGRGEISRDGYRAVFEVSSVNSRFLEISVRLPRWLIGMEGVLRGIIDKRVSRGKVFAQLTWERTEAAPAQTFNEPLAEWYIQTLQDVGKRHQINGSLTLGDLARMPDLWTSESETIDETVEAVLLDSFNLAIDQLVSSRLSEGSALAADVLHRVELVEKYVAGIKTHAAQVPAAIREKLTSRIAELLGSAGYEPQRVAQEVAFMAERADITEECVRLLVHTKHFRDALEAADAAGRRLNFLLQEMNREANTIASKSVSADISTLAVGLKEELERIREQVQNIE